MLTLCRSQPIVPVRKIERRINKVAVGSAVKVIDRLYEGGGAGGVWYGQAQGGARSMDGPLRLNPRWLRYYSFILFIQAFTFMYLYFFKMRERAFEAGGVAWWGKFRILHGLTYLVAAVLAFNKNRLAWIPTHNFRENVTPYLNMVDPLYILEKPHGHSFEDFESIQSFVRKNNLKVLYADHYLGKSVLDRIETPDQTRPFQ